MNVANLLSVLRIILIPVIVLALLSHFEAVFLFLLIVAGLTDLFDGYLARKLNQTSKFGLVLDSIADKLLIISLLTTLVFSSNLEVYFVFLMLTREIVVISGRLLLLLRIKNTTAIFYIPTTYLGKITTFAQLATIVSIAVNFLRSYFIVTAIILSVSSGIQYFWKGCVFLKSDKN